MQEIQELNALLQSKGADKGVDTNHLSSLLSPQEQESKTPPPSSASISQLLFVVANAANWHAELAGINGMETSFPPFSDVVTPFSFSTSPVKIQGKCLLLRPRF